MTMRFIAVLLASSLATGAAHAAEHDADEAPRAPPAKSTSVRGLVDGGASTATLFGIRSTAAHVGAGIGVEHGRLFIPIALDVEVGRSSGGLGMGEATFGIGFQGIVGRARIGGGLDTGFAWIRRTTASSNVDAWALDAFLLATVDLYAPSERGAIYVGIKPSVGVRWGESLFAVDHGTFSLRGAAIAGVRF